MEPASSSSSSSSAPSSESDSDSEPESMPTQSDAHGSLPTSFNDLPSDDSVELSSSNDSDSESSDSDPDSASPYSASSLPDDTTDLGDRIDARRSGDVVGVASRKRRKGEKERALSIASKRLAQFRDKKRLASSGSDDAAADGEDASDRGRKKSKHRPTEVSSRRSDFFRRGAPNINSSGAGVAIGANRYKARDPRLEGMSGHLDAEVFERRYGFLDEMKDEEISRLKKKIAARKMKGKKGQKARRKLGITTDFDGSMEEDQAELTRLTRDRSEQKRAQVKRSAKQAVKKRIRDEVAAGTRGAYYLKRSEQKRLDLEARFDDLRKRGGDAAVNKEVEKRRKKKASKDKRMLPRRTT